MAYPNTKQLKLQDALKQELQSGNFQVGDRFYTEKEIMSKYRVSSVTVAPVERSFTPLKWTFVASTFVPERSVWSPVTLSAALSSSVLHCTTSKRIVSRLLRF